MRGIMGQPAMRRYIAEERVPGPDCASDAELLAYARDNGTTVFHPTSTCRMGSDPAAVVDERLRVRGFGGLRVIDASVMPTRRLRQHQCGRGDDRGKRRRHDFGGCERALTPRFRGRPSNAPT